MGKKGSFVSHEKIVLRDSLKATVIDEEVKSEFKESALETAEINLTDIPSKFLPYPEGAIIKYRPYYFEEIKNHDQSKGFTAREEADFVLSGVLTNFDKYDLTLSDYFYINLLRRMSNIPEGDYDILARYKCKGGNHLSENVFKASTIEIDYLDVPSLPVTVKFTSGRKYSFKPLTVGGYLKLIEGGLIGKNSKNNRVIPSTAMCCVNAPFEEVYEFISKLTDSEDEFLIEYLDLKLYHSLKAMVFKCTYKHREYSEKDGWTFGKLNKLKLTEEGKNQIYELFNKYDIKFVKETDMFMFAFNDLVKKMALVKETPCECENTVELDGGDLFIGPFCEFEKLVESRICYGT